MKTRTTGASVDTYSYAGPTNNVVRITNAGGSGTTTDSVLDPQGLRFGTKTGATVAWLLADLHGSVAVGLNQAGTTVTDALRYDGAGMTVATYPGGGSAATKSWKYQGRLDVAASGPALYDFEAREMSPGLGAFTSNDTVLGSATNPRQLNRYVYVAGNPTSMIDPDGHEFTQADIEDDPGFAEKFHVVAGSDDSQWYYEDGKNGYSKDYVDVMKAFYLGGPIKFPVAPVPVSGSSTGTPAALAGMGGIAAPVGAPTPAPTTIGVCLEGSAGLGVWAGVGFCAAMTSSGQVGVILNLGGGGMIGGSLSASAGVLVADTDNLNDLSGPYATMGGSVGLIGYVGADVALSRAGGRTITSKTVKVGVGADVGLGPTEGHVGGGGSLVASTTIWAIASWLGGVFGGAR